MRSRLSVLAAITAVGLLATVVHAAPTATPSTTATPPPTPTPPTTTAPVPSPAPRAVADSRRMFATTFTNMVVYENGAGYLHAFWRTLGTLGPDTAARLQWGRGCPEISDRVFMAIHTAFSSPDRFFLIVDKAPDARQQGAYCVTGVEVERVNPPQPPPLVTPPPTPPPITRPPTTPAPTGAR
jgi:hypothetical protein